MRIMYVLRAYYRFIISAIRIAAVFHVVRSLGSVSSSRWDVHLTQTTVEIFFAGTRIASHLRLHGRPNQYSTVESHMPPDHQAYLQWNGERFIRWAEQIGQHTAAIVRIFLSAHKVEQQGYKSCMALLKLADRYAPHRRTAACARPLRISRSLGP